MVLKSRHSSNFNLNLETNRYEWDQRQYLLSNLLQLLTQKIELQEQIKDERNKPVQTVPRLFILERTSN